MSQSWKPKTLARRLVRRGEVKTLQDLRNRQLEFEGSNLKEEVLKVTNIGHGYYRRKAFVAVKD